MARDGIDEHNRKYYFCKSFIFYKEMVTTGSG